ncbi:MAG: 3-keto-5-aminohexanoate cleavage protein [Rhodospirillaceae bacterium]|nr:3-keto-5-aminohexanoate cleavage protein [Rhodospirillaceae bacterium]
MIAAWPPFIVGVAPNGARKTKADHPALPLTVDDIVRTAAACRDAGAAFIHLHIRDKAGKHLLDAEIYRAVTAAIRREVGDSLIVQITTESVGIYLPGYQMAMVREARPEACSLAIREIVPNAAAERDAAAFFAWMAAEGVQPQYILYTADEVRRFADLRARGIVPAGPPFVIYVLGRYSAGQVSDPLDLAPFLVPAERDWHWGVCAFGAKEGAVALTAAVLGGHSRVGFENNLLLGDGRIAPDNAALVAQACAGATAIGRSVADAATARALLAAPPRRD